MTEINITGALFCHAVQHHWDPEHASPAPPDDTWNGWRTRYRCDNCGSDRVDHEDEFGRLLYRSYEYTKEWHEAKKFASAGNDLYTNKEQYRAAYLQYRRNKARQQGHLRRVK